MSRSAAARRVAPWVAALAVLASACDTPTIPQRNDTYGFALPVDGGLVFHWGAGASVRVFVADAPGREGALTTAFDAAANIWEANAPFAEFSVSRASSAGAADVVLTWIDGPFAVQTAECLPSGASLGTTTFCLTAGNDAIVPYPIQGGGSSGVLFLVTISGSVATDASLLRRLVTHEIGHALGLFQHSPDAADLMFGGELTADEPTDADRATIFTLYHSSRDLLP
ncbi:MAG: hypothetical protein ABFS34_14045 [Gemmatimonadota bacterium]